MEPPAKRVRVDKNEAALWKQDKELIVETNMDELDLWGKVRKLVNESQLIFESYSRYGGLVSNAYFAMRAPDNRVVKDLSEYDFSAIEQRMEELKDLLCWQKDKMDEVCFRLDTFANEFCRRDFDLLEFFSTLPTCKYIPFGSQEFNDSLGKLKKKTTRKLSGLVELEATFTKDNVTVHVQVWIFHGKFTKNGLGPDKQLINAVLENGVVKHERIAKNSYDSLQIEAPLFYKSFVNACLSYHPDNLPTLLKEDDKIESGFDNKHIVEMLMNKKVSNCLLKYAGF